MFELRVLSGLHQGTALPLIGDHWTIGASEDDDLAIFDPGFEPQALQLVKQQNHWLLNGESLTIDTPVEIKHIQLVLSHTTSPWPQIDQTSTTNKPTTNKTTSNKLGLGILATIVATLSSWAISLPSDIKPEQQQPVIPSLLVLNDNSLVQDILTHMLKERELSAVNVEVKPKQIELIGTLVTEEDLARLNRMLTKFNRKYQSPLPVVNNVRQQEFKLPFRIIQVTEGPMAHLVTNTGNRLFVGDEIEGIRVVKIDNHRILFGGKFKLEVTW